MKSKKGMELAVNTVILFVIALVILAVGLYIIYSKILKPSGNTDSLLTCEARNGEVATSPNCQDKQPCAVCIKLPNSGSKGEPQPCCIKALV